MKQKPIQDIAEGAALLTRVVSTCQMDFLSGPGGRAENPTYARRWFAVQPGTVLAMVEVRAAVQVMLADVQGGPETPCYHASVSVGLLATAGRRDAERDVHQDGGGRRRDSSNAVSDGRYAWSSADTTEVRVSADGRVTAVAYGTVAMTAALGGIPVNTGVTVTPSAAFRTFVAGCFWATGARDDPRGGPDAGTCDARHRVSRHRRTRSGVSRIRHRVVARRPDSSDRPAPARDCQPRGRRRSALAQPATRVGRRRNRGRRRSVASSASSPSSSTTVGQILGRPSASVRDCPGTKVLPRVLVALWVAASAQAPSPGSRGSSL